jgi:radical SAM protein with 4Fe4S-binding SPASM domain
VREMREYVRKKPKALNTPAAVACLVTSGCNLSCPHCFAKAQEMKDPHDLPFEEWRKIIRILSEAGVYGIIITGGEPLLRRDLESILEEAIANGLSVSLITNGAKLTEERLKSLVSTGISNIMISLDSPFPQNHDTFRGLKGLFAQIQNATPFLEENGIDITFIAALTRYNVRETAQLIETAHNLGGTRIRLKNLCLAGRAVAHADLEPQKDEYIQAVKDIFEVDHCDDMYIRYPDLPAIYYEKALGRESYYTLIRQGKLGECGAGFIGAAVSPAGNLQLCDMIDTPLGNLVSQGLEPLWNSEEMNAVRELDVRELEPCCRCNLRDICLAGCKGLSSQYSENGFMNDLLCRKCSDLFPELFNEAPDQPKER